MALQLTRDDRGDDDHARGNVRDIRDRGNDPCLTARENKSEISLTLSTLLLCLESYTLFVSDKPLKRCGSATFLTPHVKVVNSPFFNDSPCIER